MACYECIKKANAYYDGTDASFDKIPEQAESWTIPVYSENEFIIKEHLNSKNIKPYYKVLYREGNGIGQKKDSVYHLLIRSF